QTGNYISPYHNVPLKVYSVEENAIPKKKPQKDECENLFNIIIEVPQRTNPKKETAIKKPLNPIKQESYPVWQVPSQELCLIVLSHGEIICVKSLGIVAFISKAERDWKLITVNMNDPEVSKINDINDVKKWSKSHGSVNIMFTTQAEQYYFFKNDLHQIRLTKKSKSDTSLARTGTSEVLLSRF
ncbi:Inorganic pyrophosphatase 2, mitochondrial, partial [Galemys pyrenaicus]